jgi:GNAT superfamily N-acetyltransferase
VLDISKYTFSKLIEDFEIGKFKCGVNSLDHFLKNFALLNQKNNISQTYIVHLIEKKNIIGYYSISSTNVIKDELPAAGTIDLPNYPIPCILIGRLAVDKQYQKMGFGKYLLYDALKRAKAISNIIGCYAVIVEAIDKTAADFYKKYAFTEFVEKKLSLYIPISEIP